MYHIVYLTTNQVNNKIYVGVHSTYNLDDGYIGSGTTFKKAIKKYGKQHFNRTILYICLDAIDAYFIEECIVDSQFINRKDVYNTTLGGVINSHNHLRGKTYEEVYGIRKSFLLKKSRSNTHKGKIRTPEERKKQCESRRGFVFSEEAKEKLRATHKNTNFSSKHFLFISPTNEEFYIHNNFKKFCDEHKISKHIMTYHRNIKIHDCIKECKSKTNTTGWECREL